MATPPAAAKAVKRPAGAAGDSPSSTMLMGQAAKKPKKETKPDTSAASNATPVTR